MRSVDVLGWSVVLSTIALALAGCGGGEGGGTDGGARADAGTREDAGGMLEDAGGTLEDAGAATDAGMAADPSAAGPYATTTTTDTVMRGSRSTPVTVHVPTLDAGARAPLVVMLPGFQLSHTNYEATASYVASHGFVVVQADPTASLFSADHPAMAMDAAEVITWATTTSTALSPIVDAEHIAIAGHSLGGKIAALTATMDARIDAVLGLDPVDGGGPGGPTPMTPDIVPSPVGSLTIVVGFMGETLDGAGGFMPCAPTAQNYAQFYDATTIAAWAGEWTLPGASHMSFVDDLAACGFTCGVCATATTPQSTTLGQVRTLATAFVRRHLRGETAMDAWLTGVSVPAGVTTRHRP